ncbi:hypothetical protein OJ998_25810 [Solirubrobacter taibaiensis]|nr:hypothetical protein [Solirubrobacter taibaiensis]
MSGYVARRVSNPDEPTSAVLRSATRVVSSLLHRHDFSLAEPIEARFRTNEHGSSGIAVTVKLDDPVRAGAARALLLEQFGGAGVDDFEIA